MEDEVVTSGFVGEHFSDSHAFTDLQEIYSSASGYNRLFRCERYGRIHVLKTLQASYVGSRFHEQALHKEFAIGYQLEHPHICRTLGWEQVPGLGCCIVMEYIDGMTLKAFMRQGKLTPPLARKLIAELCSALKYMHSKQIIHRDLKPDNMLVTHNGNYMKLIDFSLSDSDDYDVLKIPAGTRYYLAPEMLQPDARPDLRADIYSLGVVIGEMALLLKDKRLAAVSRKCTQRNPACRYASADEVAAAVVARKPSVYRYVAAAVLGLVAVGVAGYGIAGSREAAMPEQAAFPVYGNQAQSDAVRRILAEERARRTGTADSLNRIPSTEDSLRLMERLREALDAEYPLPVQRQSAAYRKEWETIQRSAEELLSSTISPNRPQ